jgi:hypothetical protein
MSNSSFNRRSEEKRKLWYAVCEGGHDADPDPNMSGRCRFRIPQLHGKNIPTAHLPFVASLSTQDGQYSFNRPPKPGQTCLVMQEEDGHCINLGPVTGVEKADKNQPGGATTVDNISLDLKKAQDQEAQIKIPPDVEEKDFENETGFQGLAKKRKEKDKLEKHSLYTGLPTNAGLYSLTGIRTKNIVSVSTARNPLADSITPEIAGQMPGSGFSLSGLLGQLAQKVKDELMGSMSADMQAATTNLLQLMPTETTSQSPGNFIFSGQVNPQTFMNNAMNAIKGAKNVGELQNAFNTIQDTSDIAFTGMDQYEDVEVTYESDSSSNTRARSGQQRNQTSCNAGCGAINQRVNPCTGRITCTSVDPGTDDDGNPRTNQNPAPKENGEGSGSNSDIGGAVQQALKLFMGLISGIPSAEGNLWGQDTQMPKLKDRLASFQSINQMKQAMEKLNPSKYEPRQRLYSGGKKGATKGSQWLSSGSSSGTPTS